MSKKELKYEQSPLRIDYSLKNLVRMNLNENLILPQTFLRAIAVRCLDKLESRFYPSELDDGEIFELIVEISKYCNCSTNMICIGDGSDQLIDLLFRMKLRKSSDALVTVNPTFSLYGLMALRQGAKVINVPVRPSSSPNPFALDERALIEACKSKNAKVLALASPNNPTAVQYPLDQIKRIIESLPNVTILLDEAYVEYASYDATRLLGVHENLLLMRTFSKAFALASHRLGYFVSSNIEFAREFNQEYQYPYPVAAFGALMATMLLRNKSEVLASVNRTKELRKELGGALSERFAVIDDPQANFVLVKTKSAGIIANELLEKYRIALKLIETIGSEKGFLRITVGTHELNERLLYALRRVVSGKA
ncbi:MAG: pyridoxal phosphate-dependent aminotransferase [Nitrososphaerales archaeon]